MKYISNILLAVFTMGLLPITAIAQNGVYINGAQVTVDREALLYVKGDINNNTGAITNKNQLIITSDFNNTAGSFENTAQTYISGNFSADSESDITNTDSIAITGNWENAGSHSSSGGIGFVGEDQTISHHDNTFNRVGIYGGGTKTVSTGFSVDELLELDDGILVPKDSSHIIANDLAYVTDGSEYSYINGLFYHSGSGDKYYPVGNDTEFRPIEMNANEGTEAVVGFQMHTGLEDYKTDQAIIEVQPEYYWEKHLLSGSLDSATLAVPYELLDLPDHHTQAIIEAENLDSAFKSTIRDEDYFAERLSDAGWDYIGNAKSITGKFFAVGVEQLLDIKLYYLPNALSPNSPDPEDRVIKVYGNLFRKEGFYFRVYNQWGNMIFESTDIAFMETEGWDGTNSRTKKKETTGQYQYVFRGKYKTGDYYSEAGDLYIID